MFRIKSPWCPIRRLAAQSLTGSPTANTPTNLTRDATGEYVVSVVLRVTVENGFVRTVTYANVVMDQTVE